MKDFFSTAKFKILVALAVVLAGMMAWAGANNRLTSAPQELLGAAAVPFQKIGALLSEGVSGVVTKYAEYDSIVEENEQLKQENYDLRQQLVDYDKLKAENEAFRDLNNIREQNPEFEYASAFVIGRDPLDQFGGFTVDAGTLDNVKKGDVVVSDKGYLVGIVLEPGLTSSKVLTILSPSLNAAGVVSRTRDNGILTGDSAYSGDGLTTFTGLPRDTLATVGDEIITTGLGEVFPADILVGTVQEVDVNSCKVLTILHPGFSAAAVVSRTRDNGILCGDSAYADQGLCTMTNLSRDTLAIAGDQIITTGLGGVYPSDVLVGTIRELVPESSGKSAVAVVQPGAEVRTLTHVFVITDY